MLLLKKKRIYLTRNNTVYCVVKLYKNKIDMQKAYEQDSPQDQNHYSTLGAHCGFVSYTIKDKKECLSPQTGIVFLCFEHCGAGVVTHELLHAVLWANKFSKRKKQYPIVIKNMQEEETILHNFTYAVKQFYLWYWRIEKLFTS